MNSKIIFADHYWQPTHLIYFWVGKSNEKKPFQNLEQDAWKSPAGQIGPYREESSSPQNKTKSKTILGVKYS